MNELIKVNMEGDKPTVSGRDLHAALEVKTAYKDWFPRMCEYGFEEGTDFCSNLSESTGGRPAVDHQLSIEMAKQLCMLQRTEIGKTFRQYFIKVEEAWNDPNAVMARALQIAERKLEETKQECMRLSTQVEFLAPKAEYTDKVLKPGSLLTATTIAKDFGMSAYKFNRLLERLGVQYKQGGHWHLKEKYNGLGYTDYTTYLYDEDENKTDTAMRWTQKGRAFLYNLLQECDITPQEPFQETCA